MSLSDWADLLRLGKDAAVAALVPGFPGDINALCHQRGPLLVFAAAYGSPKTLVALAARSDIDPYRCSSICEAPVWWAIQNDRLPVFLDAFPAFNVNAPCRVSGEAPLEAIANEPLHDSCYDVPMWGSVGALLDAGALLSVLTWSRLSDRRQSDHWDLDPWVEELWELWRRQHVQWTLGIRRHWMAACAVGVACSLEPPSRLLACILTDTDRICMSPTAALAPSHQVISEYAGLIAAFL